MPAPGGRRQESTVVPRAPKLILALLTAAFGLCGLAFAVGTPLFRNFDEQTHVDRVGVTARHPFDLPDSDLRRTFGAWAALDAVGLPDAAIDDSWPGVPAERPEYLPFRAYPGGNQPQESGCPGPCQNYQYGHPPAWYLLTAPVAALLDDRPFPATVLWLRVLDVLLVLPVVPLTWYTARQVWPGATRRPLAAAGLVALFGPLAFTAAGVNNDALVLVLGAAVLALMARILRVGARPRLALWLGVLVAAGLLTKVQFVPVAPFAGLAVLVAPTPRSGVPGGRRANLSDARIEKGPGFGTRNRVGAALAFGLPALVGALWWLRNLMGDGVLSPSESEILAPARAGPWQDATFLGYVLDQLALFGGRFWGLYGFPLVTVAEPWRTGLNVAVVAVVAAWLACRRWGRPTAQGLRWLVLAAVPLALFVAVAWASFDVYRTNGEERGLAPRYVYLALPALAVGLIGALSTIGSRVGLAAAGDRTRGRLLALGLAAVAVVGSAGSFVVAMRGRYQTTSLAELADRAAAVAPVADPVGLLAALGACWLVAVAAAVAISLGASRRSGPPPVDPMPGAATPADLTPGAATPDVVAGPGDAPVAPRPGPMLAGGFAPRRRERPRRTLS